MRVACFCGTDFNCQANTGAVCPTCLEPVDPFEGPRQAEPDLVTPAQAAELRAMVEG